MRTLSWNQPEHICVCGDFRLPVVHGSVVHGSVVHGSVRTGGGFDASEREDGCKDVVGGCELVGDPGYDRALPAHGGCEQTNEETQYAEVSVGGVGLYRGFGLVTWLTDPAFPGRKLWSGRWGWWQCGSSKSCCSFWFRSADAQQRDGGWAEGGKQSSSRGVAQGGWRKGPKGCTTHCRHAMARCPADRSRVRAPA